MLHSPVLRRKAMPALTFAQWGILGWRPPFPSMLVSKHMPPAKKTPILGIGKDWWERYNFGVEPGLPLPPSEAARLFSCPIAPVLGDNVSYVQNGRQRRPSYIRIR
jgi:hypothetical protein